MATPQTPHTCAICRARFLIRNNDEPRPLIHIDGPKSDLYRRIWPVEQLPVTLKELNQMSQNGCKFATFLHTKLTTGMESFPGDTIVNRSPPNNEDQGAESCSVIFTLSGDNDDDTHARFTYMTYPDSPIAHEVLQRVPNPNPASETSFSLVKKWIRECQMNHLHCRKATGTFMPKRVLRISAGGEEVKIVEDAELSPYSVLSYCWGGPQKVQLTAARLQTRLLAIELAQTIQDAIRVCIELGIIYLWVDSLCIYQDDPEDKAIEISNMANIYESADIAILASRAKGVEEGFLGQRWPFGAGPDTPSFCLPYMCQNGTIGTVILSEESRAKEHVDPLSHRAWAFQEFILSSRIIDYGELRTSWICREGNTLTDGFYSPPTSWWSRQRFHKDTSLIPSGNKRDNYLLWSTIVQCYMESAITDPYDRLPALAGIAERLNIVLQDRYLAGCWKSYIWLDLLWWQEDYRSLERFGEYFAPSWSWASIPTGNLRYISTRSCIKDEAFTLEGYDAVLIHTTLPYGNVSSGYLQITGRLVPDECLPRITDRNLGLQKDGLPVPGRQNISLRAAVTPDPLIHDFDNTQHNTHGLCVCWDEKRHKIWGLVVYEKKPGYFVRVGLISLEQQVSEPSEGVSHAEWVSEQKGLFKEWRESFEVKTITLY